MENKCCSYASRYLNPDYARICFADPDGPTSHASSISGRCRRQSSSTALSASGARSRKQCPRPTQACPSTASHTKGRSSSPTGRDRSCWGAGKANVSRFVKLVYLFIYLFIYIYLYIYSFASFDGVTLNKSNAISWYKWSRILSKWTLETVQSPWDYM